MHFTDPPIGTTTSPWWGASTQHYENFPVGSWLMPRHLRPAVTAIYRFARYADDVADEGTASDAERLAELERLDDAIIDLPNTSHPIVTLLAGPIASHRLDRQHFRDLLSAFSQDVQVKRYASIDAVLDYCARSANPVGRLMLELFECTDRRNLAHADAICSALQLINFAQDVAIDWAKDRVYLPIDSLHRHGLTDTDIGLAVRERQASPALREAIASLCQIARQLLNDGRPLLRNVPRRLSWELRAILAGGSRVLDRLQAVQYDPIAHRPVLGLRDALALLRLTLAPIPAAR